jgi:calcineurin-like phosphoesterase family protein
VFGNHDKVLKQYFSRGSVTKGKDKVSALGDMYIFKDNRDKITVCHYAMRKWCPHNENNKSYHAFGHSHGTLTSGVEPYSMDVGVDCHNYTPLSLEDFKNKSVINCYEVNPPAYGIKDINQ